MSSRSEKQRRREHRKAKKQRRSASSSPDVAPLGDLILSNPPGVPKMSEILEGFVAPEWAQARGEDDMRKILSIGIVAWNLALLPLSKRAAALEKILQQVPSAARANYRDVVETLVRRKDSQFPHIQRAILSFDLTCRPGADPYLQVISSLPA